MPDEKTKTPSVEQRRAPRFRVNWHAEIVFADQTVHRSFINDISVQGASVFLGDNVTTEEATLHIHIPPLTKTSPPHVLVVSGRMVYTVFDSDKQMYRIAFVFLRFRQEPDRAYLEERLSRHQTEIHEPEPWHPIEL